MKTNKYESPEVIVITLGEDIITASFGKGETPKQEMDW